MYKFNKKDILDRIEEVEHEKAYWINYNVPKELENTLDILIEQDLGDDEICVLDDVAEEKDERIVGKVLVEFFNEFNFETLFSKASQFDILSKGYDLIER
jgi:16S rRNA C1402 (ribose-2'-O) methylase RsmI